MRGQSMSYVNMESPVCLILWAASIADEEGGTVFQVLPVPTKA